MDSKQYPVTRRPFLSLLGIGTAALGAGMAALSSSRAQAAAGDFQPTRHASDDWLDQIPGQHRFVVDSSTADGGGSALLYAGNFFVANKQGYDLDPPDLAIVVVLRHLSTPFAYTDEMWAKYGAILAASIGFTDPKTNAAPVSNLYNRGDYGLTLQNFGTTIPSLIDRNVQFGVCGMATRFFAGAIADETGGDADAIDEELVSNLIPNSHVVPAGIIATSRAQERGYTFLYAG
jgi:hypothetical protein